MAGSASSGEPALTCDTLDACGGDAGGTWRLVSFCGDLRAAIGQAAISDDMCATLDDLTLDATGSLSVDAQQQVSLSSAVYRLGVAVTWDAYCAGGDVEAIAGLCPSLEERLALEYEGAMELQVIDSSCRAVSVGCACDIVLETHEALLDATEIELVLAEGDYCATGSQLMLLAPPFGGLLLEK